MQAKPDTDPYSLSAGRVPASICLVLFLLLTVPVLSGEEAPLFALKAWRVLDGAGNTYEDGVVVVQGGRIKAVGDESIVHPACPIHDLGKVYLCPGLIDLFTGLGAERHMAETASSVQTEASAGDLFHPFHEDFERALACGITTAVLAPNGLNLVGGRAVVVKTAGSSRETRIVCAKGPVVMTVSPSCFRRQRTPTSRMGALDLLYRSFREAEPGSILNDLAQGKGRAFFLAEKSYDLLAGAELAEEFKFALTLVGASEADDEIDRLCEGGHFLVFGPFDYSTPERTLRVPAAAGKAGMVFGFTGGSPMHNPAALRRTAALAVEAGLDRDEAFAALTGKAAAVAGIDQHVGALAPGLDADMAVFSDHPVSLKARLLRAYIDGREMFRAQTTDTERLENL